MENSSDLYLHENRVKNKPAEQPYLSSGSPHHKRPRVDNIDDDEREETDEQQVQPEPEYVNEHTKIVASHYNALEEKGLAVRKNSRIFHMRNFNNWVKSMLINEYLSKIRDTLKLGAPLRVLDMCCGKGGDLLKWQKGKITHLICTDIAEVSVEQCESRYKSGNNRPQFTAEFFACDSTLVRLREKYHDPSIELNMVSCQFAFHYSFESLKQAECMLRNAAECLLPGGYFIGTIPDAYEIVKRQRAADSDTFGNDLYTISFQCDTNDIPLFGAKYDFHLEDVVDCPEFLVHFPTLVKLARKFGLELEKKERFIDFYKRSLPNGRNLLEKMSALETFTDHSNNLVSNNPEEYEHAASYLSTSTIRDPSLKKVGTISLSEWEAITIYTTFVFRKVKTNWNAEGKPEYKFSD